MQDFQSETKSIGQVGNVFSHHLKREVIPWSKRMVLVELYLKLGSCLHQEDRDSMQPLLLFHDLYLTSARGKLNKTITIGSHLVHAYTPKILMWPTV